MARTKKVYKNFEVSVIGLSIAIRHEYTIPVSQLSICIGWKSLDWKNVKGLGAKRRKTHNLKLLFHLRKKKSKQEKLKRLERMVKVQFD